MDRQRGAGLKPDLLALHRWYRRRARDLPWRRAPTPYRVLLSEALCQQTRVETALPYYERFVARWPTLEALAAAEEAEVLEAWAGLGYYSRARRLLAAARAAVERGGIPRDPDELVQLPGVGPYTAGAVASIAFGVPIPAVDGNVLRVLGRWYRVEKPVDRPAGKRIVTDFAAALHRGSTIPPGDLNQALMELGATVCTPRNPTCETCPIRRGCGAREHPEAWPKRGRRTPPVPITGVAGVTRRGEAHLVVRREGSGLLAGMWGPPWVLGVEPDDHEALEVTFRAAGCSVRSVRPVGEIRHVFSHRDARLRVYRVDAEPDGPPGSPWSDRRWMTDQRRMSALGRKVVEAASRDAPLLAAEDGVG